MEITINLKTADDAKGIENDFETFESAIEYLEKWQNSIRRAERELVLRSDDF